jgi:hypothetical protein
VTHQDPAVREEAHGVLQSLFHHLGQSRAEDQPPAALGGLGADLEEFMAMPLDLAVVFMDMATGLTELVLKSLEEAGIVLVKGLTPM